MTGGVNCGGGRRTRLGNCLVCARRPLPNIYRWEGGKRSQGGAQVGGILLGVSPKSRLLPYIGVGGRLGRVAPPFPFSNERERQEGLALPLFFTRAGRPGRGAHQPPVGWYFPPLAH